MKLFVVAAILGVCLADRLDNKYLPPRGNAGAGGFGPGFGAGGAPAFGGGAGGAGGFGLGGAGGAGGFGPAAGAGKFGAGSAGGYSSTQYSGNVYNAPAGQYNAGVRGGAASADANAQILKQNSEVTAEGFSYNFETSNGIRADASGVATDGVQSQGSFAYKGDDGQDYSITYTADENGFVPQGAHLPTPPPIPEEILRSLEQNARDEAAGIVDDGTYRGEGAGAGAAGYSSGGAGGYSGAGAGASFGGASGAYSGAGAAFGGAGGAGGAFGGAGGRGSAGAGAFGSRGSSFSAGASRKYVAPAAGGSRGSGNFNAQTGYNY